MIDLHSHILCGVDDGAASEEISRQMLERYREQQILTVAATAHGEQCSPELYDQRFAEVSRIAAEYGIELLSGTEYLYGDLLELPREKLHPIAGKNYFLLDLRRIYPDSAVCRNLYKITSRGCRILLAHPERLWHSGECLMLVRRLTENPAIYCQLNAGSILGDYGKNVRICARQLLEAGLCAVIASDAHNTERQKLPECREKLLKIYPESLVSLWMEKNPQRVIAGEALSRKTPERSLLARLRRAWNFSFA